MTIAVPGHTVGLMCAHNCGHVPWAVELTTRDNKKGELIKKKNWSLTKKKEERKQERKANRIITLDDGKDKKFELQSKLP